MLNRTAVGSKVRKPMMPASRSFFLALSQRIGKERFVVGFDMAGDVVAGFVGQVEDQISFSVAGVGDDAFAAFVDESSGIFGGAVLDDKNLHLPTSPFKVLQRDRFRVESLIFPFEP